MAYIETLTEFKEVATLTHDNRETASKNWAKTWGLTYWEDVWYYKEYTIGNLKYRTGQVVQRHTKSFVQKFYFENKEIPQREFIKHAKLIEYKPKIAFYKRPLVKQTKQLSLFED